MNRMTKYSLLILLAIGTAVSLWTIHADAANQDLERLLPLSKQIIASSDRKVIIKHTDSYQSFTNKESFAQIGRKVSTQLNIPVSSEIIEERDHLLYQAKTTDLEGIETTLLFIGFPNGSTELIISAETSRPQDTVPIMKVQKQLTEKLTAIGIKPNWNIMIQGSAVISSSIKEQEASLEPSFAKQLQAQKVTRYEDAGSLSISYYSPKISHSTAEGDKEKMNLQVAVHRNSITQQQRITIGSPAISIEY
ncbi:MULTISPECIES: YwmB family TATA-box binding protein [unclassified Paenibacillus]|uniref:YwmB family TATA-box binding protein n=1 Tax=unclassified Paenibacillus TaxID=185978 RepID=UPI0036337E78